MDVDTEMQQIDSVCQTAQVQQPKKITPRILRAVRPGTPIGKHQRPSLTTNTQTKNREMLTDIMLQQQLSFLHVSDNSRRPVVVSFKCDA